jgi:hypothetical protein
MKAVSKDHLQFTIHFSPQYLISQLVAQRARIFNATMQRGQRTFISFASLPLCVKRFSGLSRLGIKE